MLQTGLPSRFCLIGSKGRSLESSLTRANWRYTIAIMVVLFLAGQIARDLETLLNFLGITVAWDLKGVIIFAACLGMMFLVVENSRRFSQKEAQEDSGPVCWNCGYSLVGLSAQAEIADCPECSEPGPLRCLIAPSVLHPERESALKEELSRFEGANRLLRLRNIVLIFSALGLIASLLVGLRLPFVYKFIRPAMIILGAITCLSAPLVSYLVESIQDPLVLKIRRIQLEELKDQANRQGQASGTL